MSIEPYPVKTNDYTIADKGKSYFDTYKIGYKDGEEKTIGKMLEIIDDVSDKASAGGEYWNSAKTVKVLRRRIMALKGGEQE